MEDYLGHSHSYWIELHARFETDVPTGPRLLDEIVRLRGRLAFYESRLAEMAPLLEQKV